MTTAVQPLWDGEFKEGEATYFRQSHADHGHIIVSRFRNDGSKEIIGHVYIEIDGEEIKYFSTNRKGREIFPPTTDFNKVEEKFDRYARLVALKQRAKEVFKRPFINKNYSPFKKSNPMKTQSKPTQEKQKKENQLIFVEYEKATGDGHFVTIVDSYRNVIGRIYKSYNDETKKYEYAAYDHAGHLMGQNEKLWELKKDFSNNREQLLKDAHQRRIESKEKSKDASRGKSNEKSHETSPQMQHPEKAEERNKETQMLRQGKKSPEKENSITMDKSDMKMSDKESGRTNVKENALSNEEQDKQQEREEELSDLRDDQGDDRGEMDMER